MVTDPTTDFEHLRASDGVGTREIAIRLTITTSAGIVLWLVTDLEFMLVWAVGYIILSLIYLAVLRVETRPVRLPLYLAVLLMYGLVSGWYVALAVFLLLQENTALNFVGVSGLIALAFHNLTRHNKMGPVAIWDFLLLLAAILMGARRFALTAESTAEAAAIVVAVAGVAIYYTISFLSSLETHRVLRDSQEAEFQSQKMRAIGQLTSGVAHDFNNILTVIRGNLDLVSEIEDPKEKEALLDEARKSSDRAAHLVRQLLAYSRKSQLQNSEVTIAPFLSGFARNLARILPEPVHLTVVEPLPLATIWVDESLLSSAILNAVINARDALMPTGGDIEISVQVQDDQAHFAIQDSGPGMHADLIERATEPFFTTKPIGEGSGLGLSMIAGFAEQSGGKLELENLPGGGFRLTIILPIGRPD